MHNDVLIIHARLSIANIGKVYVREENNIFFLYEYTERESSSEYHECCIHFCIFAMRTKSDYIV